MAICGIYKYENLIDGKIYIGQSVDIAQRRREHRHDAFISSRDNDTIFHQALRDFGEDNFKFNIIEKCSIDKLDEKEIYWIAYYHSWIGDPQCWGYNMTRGGNQYRGDNARKPVCQYDLSGNFIKEYESASEAARQLNVFKSNITSACRGETSQCGGYQWRYKDEDKKIIKTNFIGKRPVEKYNFLGELLETYDNATLAAQKNNLCYQSITACCRGEMTFAGDYQWKYQGDNKIIKTKGKNNGTVIGKYDQDNNLINIYPSYAEAARQEKMSRNTIKKSIDYNSPTKGNYYWKIVTGGIK